MIPHVAHQQNRAQSRVLVFRRMTRGSAVILKSLKSMTFKVLRWSVLASLSCVSLVLASTLVASYIPPPSHPFLIGDHVYSLPGSSGWHFRTVGGRRFGDLFVGGGKVFASVYEEQNIVNPTLENDYTELRTCIRILKDPSFELSFPILPFLLLTGIYPLVHLWVISSRWLQKQKAGLYSLCQNCGYNLTANISGTCPECGDAIHLDS